APDRERARPAGPGAQEGDEPARLARGAFFDLVGPAARPGQDLLLVDMRVLRRRDTSLRERAAQRLGAPTRSSPFAEKDFFAGARERKAQGRATHARSDDEDVVVLDRRTEIRRRALLHQATRSAGERSISVEACSSSSTTLRRKRAA